MTHIFSLTNMIYIPAIFYRLWSIFQLEYSAIRWKCSTWIIVLMKTESESDMAWDMRYEIWEDTLHHKEENRGLLTPAPVELILYFCEKYESKQQWIYKFRICIVLHVLILLLATRTMEQHTQATSNKQPLRSVFSCFLHAVFLKGAALVETLSYLLGGENLIEMFTFFQILALLQTTLDEYNNNSTRGLLITFF